MTSAREWVELRDRLAATRVAPAQVVKLDNIQVDDAGCADLPLTISRFTKKTNPYTRMEQMTWGSFIEMFRVRREGDKDGACFAAAEFTPLADGGVHRSKQEVTARTCIAIDIETKERIDKETGEITTLAVPGPLADLVDTVGRNGWAAIVYSSHNHTPAAPRRRIVLPLTRSIPHHLRTAIEIMAEQLGIRSVLDTSKIGAESLFYFPSCPPGGSDGHEFEIIDGEPVDAEWLTDLAEQRLEEIEAEGARKRAEAMAEAERKRAAKIAAGHNPNDSLIDKLRDKLDLEAELTAHGYTKEGKRFLHPASESGIPGVMIFRGNDGIERAFSHHGNDPLAPDNLPSWCRTLAVDAVDVALILQHHANTEDDRREALHKMAVQFGLQTERPKPRETGTGDWTADVPPPETTDENVDSSTGSDPDVAPPQPAPDPLIIDLDAWLEAEIPKRDWVARGYFLRGAITLIAGAPGASKSSMGVVWSCALALGREYHGFRPAGPMRVTVYNVEDDTHEQRRRFSATLRQFNAVPAQVAGQIARVTPTGVGVLYDFDQQTGAIRETKAMAALKDHVELFKPDVLILDPFAELHGAPENDNGAIRLVMARLRAFAVDNKLALGIAHHTRKGPQQAGDPDTARGASSIIGAARLVLTVTVMQEGEAQAFGLRAEDRKHYFRLDLGKSNYSVLSDATWFQRLSLDLDNGDDVANIEPWSPPESAVAPEARTAIEAGIEAGSAFGPWSPRLSDDERSVKNLFERNGVTTTAAQKVLLKALKAAGYAAYPFRRADNRQTASGLRSPANKPAANWLDEAGDIDSEVLTGT